MAAEWDETCLDLSFSDYGVNTVIMLQAVCRGWLARKKLKEAQTQFLEIVEELDGPSVLVEWTQSALPLPVMCKASRKARARKQQQQEQRHTCGHGAEKTEHQSSCCCGKPAIGAECLKCADKSSAVSTRSRAVNQSETEKKTENVAEKEDGISVISEPNSDKTAVQSDQADQMSSSEKIHAAQDKKQDPCIVNTDTMAPVQQESSHQTDSNLQTKTSQSQSQYWADDKGSGNVMQTDPKQLMKNGTGGDHDHQTVGDEGDDDDDDDSERRNKDFPINSVSASGDAPPASQTHAHTQPSLQQSAVASSEPSGMRRVDSFHGDQTSVWDSSSSVMQDHHNGGQKTGCVETGADMSEASLRCLGTEDLLKQRQNTALELLWVQQAIISRKKYLKLKMQMDGAT